MSLLKPITFEQALKVGSKSAGETKKLRESYSQQEQFREQPSRKGFFNKVISLLNRGNYASANLALDAINGGGFHPLKSVWDGVTGKKPVFYSDVLEEAGVENKLIKHGLGFALDVALDPVTYLTFGYGAGAKIGGKVLSKSGTQLLKSWSTKMGRQAAEKAMLKEVAKKGGQKYLSIGGLKLAGKTLVKPEVFSKVGEITRITDAGKFIGRTAPVQWLGRSFIPKFKPADITKSDWKKIQRFTDLRDEMIRVGEADIMDKAYRIAHTFSKKDRSLITTAIENSVKGIKKRRKLKKLEFEEIKANLHKLLPTRLHAPAEEMVAGFRKMATKEQSSGLLKMIRLGYVPHIYTKKAKGRWSRPRVFNTIEEAEKAGYEPIKDIATLFAMRGVDSVRMTAQKKFYSRMGKTFGEKVTFKKIKGGGSVAKLLPGHKQAKAGFLRDLQFKDEIAREIDEFTTAFTDEATGKFLKGYDRALAFWKGSVTSLFPAFHTRNATSNYWQMYIGGVNPLDFPARSKTAYELQRLAHAVKLGKKTTMLYPGKVVNVEELGNKLLNGYKYLDIIKDAKKTGVMNRGWYGLEVATQGAAGQAKEMAAHRGVGKLLNPMAFGREVGTNVENNARLGFFIDRLIKGDAVKDAATTTKKFLFDYGELTAFEKKVMRRIVPFYTWMRKNIALQLESLARTPGRYAALEKFRNEVNAISEREAPSEKYMPDWQKEMYGLRIPFWKTKEGKFNYVFPDIAFMDLTRGTQLERWASSISPLIKTPFEIAMNYDMFRRRQLSDPNLPPALGYWERAKKAALNNLRLAGMIERMTREERTLLDNVLDDIIGMNVYEYNPAMGAKLMRLKTKREKAAKKRLKKGKEKGSILTRILP